MKRGYNMDLNITVGQRLKLLRSENLWTLEQFASKVGISTSTYGGYERGYRSPSLDNLVEIAQFYGVSSDYILGISNDREPKKVDGNMCEYLEKDDLEWNGVPISEEEIKPIKDILKLIAKNKQYSK